MWDVPGPPPRANPGRVSPSLPSQACPASVSLGGKWEEALLGGMGKELGSHGLQPASPLPSPHSGTPDRRLKPQAPGPLSQGGHWPPPWPLLHSGLTELPSGNVLSSENACCLSITGTIKSRTTQRMVTVTQGSQLMCPHLPLPQPQNGGQAFSHWGSEGHTQSYI